jgi:hypothetical protein
MPVLWAVTRVASTSMISGLSASMSWSGLLVVADVDLRQVTSSLLRSTLQLKHRAIATWLTARRGAQSFCPRLRPGPNLVDRESSLLTEGGKIEIDALTLHQPVFERSDVGERDREGAT